MPLSTPADLDLLEAALATVIAEAGALALDFARKDVRRWTKVDASLVTECDIAVDTFLGHRLQALSPDIGWLSEETADTPARLECERVWIVDPIDGTRAFVQGEPNWTISVALVEAGRPVLASIFNPTTDERFTARRDRGAWLNGSRLAARSATGLAGASVVGPRVMLESLDDSGIAPAPRIHSLAYRLATVAAARVDAALASGRAKDWDIAAADLILTESGASLIGMDGDPPGYNRPEPVHRPMVGASEPLNTALRDAIRRAAESARAPTWI